MQHLDDNARQTNTQIPGLIALYISQSGCAMSHKTYYTTTTCIQRADKSKNPVRLPFNKISICHGISVATVKVDPQGEVLRFSTHMEAEARLVCEMRPFSTNLGVAHRGLGTALDVSISGLPKPRTLSKQWRFCRSKRIRNVVCSITVICAAHA